MQKQKDFKELKLWKEIENVKLKNKIKKINNYFFGLEIKQGEYYFNKQQYI